MDETKWVVNPDGDLVEADDAETAEEEQ